MQPTTDRKIRCEQTNALKLPGTCDQKAHFDALMKHEIEARPTKKPRFINRICQIAEPAYHPFTRETGLAKILYCIEGHALLIADDGQTRFMTAGSGLFIPAGYEYDLLLGRGTQNWLSSHWEADSPVMSMPELVGGQSFTINDTSEIFRKFTEKVITEVNVGPLSENLVHSWLHMLIHESQEKSRSYSLIPPLEAEAESIQDLLAAIKLKPSAEWNLNSAAELAGYSPFHLSRLFRSTVNLGLPKFVEASRTEKAIEDLLAGTTPMNLLFEVCGFGSPQAMRMAIREFTGFLPSELRSRTGE